MVAAKKIMHSFLNDSARMADEAVRIVGQLQEQSNKGSVSPAQVQELYRLIHTLKGTASMVSNAERVVASLEGIEAKLGCQAVATASQAFDWLPLAASSLEETARILEDMRTREKFRPSSSHDERDRSRGLTVEHDGAEHWYALADIERVLGPLEWSGGRVHSHQGKWIPVLGTKKGFALILKGPRGTYVQAIDEIRGVVAAAAGLVRQAG